MKPIVVVGAGIAGLVVGYKLVKRGYKVIIIEKDVTIGGLAKTFRYDSGFSFDIGPHRFYTQKPQVSEFINNILGNEYLNISRNSQVHFLGKYYSWPLKPLVFFDLPVNITMRSAMELICMILDKKKINKPTFEDYILQNYGPTLYNIFFKAYTKKFLGIEPSDTHSEWAKEGMRRTIIDESIASRHLRDILKLIFMFSPSRTQFIYPVSGIGYFCEKLAEEIKRSGGEIITGTPVAKINYCSQKVEQLSLGNRHIIPELLIWSGSLNNLCSLLSFDPCELGYLSLHLYNIELNKKPKRAFQWCYYGDEKIIFSRVSQTTEFSKNLAPVNRAGLCVEVTSNENITTNFPEITTDRVVNDLKKVDLISNNSDIGNIYTEKIEDAYPVYSLDYPGKLAIVKNKLKIFKNLILLGRTGLFWYNNMDESIENALKTSESIIKKYEETNYGK